MFRIVAADCSAIAADRHELHFDSVAAAKVLHHRSVDVGAIELRRRRFVLRCAFEVGEEIQIELNDIRHLLGREVGGVDADEVAPVVKLRCERARRFDRCPIRVV